MENYNKLKKQIAEYYQDLLIMQYHDKPKAKAFVKFQIEQLFSELLVMQIRDAFDVDTAIGVQLDIIGKWVGVDRIFRGQKFDNRTWFAMPSWDDTPNNYQHGFSTYDNFPTNGGFLYYDWILSTTTKLNDNDFRALVKLKIIKNRVEHSPKPIDDAIHKLFGNLIYTTWGSCMEMTYHYNNTKYSIVKLGQEKDCFPIPTGVRAIFTEVSST